MANIFGKTGTSGEIELSRFGRLLFPPRLNDKVEHRGGDDA
jgi:hypothetical protein